MVPLSLRDMFKNLGELLQEVRKGEKCKLGKIVAHLESDPIFVINKDSFHYGLNASDDVHANSLHGVTI